MSSVNIHPAPDLSSHSQVEDKWQREKRAFYRLLPQLLASHRGKYVAIHDEQVVGEGDELVQVTLEAYRKYGYIPIYVDLITDEVLEPVRIPSPRIPSIRTQP